jgi:predicted dienelactone hydrolase
MDTTTDEALTCYGITLLVCIGLGLVAVGAEASTDPDTRCLLASGKAATICVRRYTKAVGACRKEQDATCETALRSEGGGLDGLVAATEPPTRKACSAASADRITFRRGLDDLVFRTAQACEAWSEDFFAITYADEPARLSATARACQNHVARWLGRLRDDVIREYGRRCYVPEFAGGTCDRSRRHAAVGKALAAARRRILGRCGTDFDELDLAAGATLEERVDALLDRTLARARHLAERVFPPLNLGPSGLFGPYPVGVRTYHLVDPSRLDVTGSGPRPLVAELYYPSTAAAVAGVERDTPLPGLVTPTHRDVALAPGTFPLVLFSPGLLGTPSEYVHLASHLASHGVLVAGVTHHGELAPEVTTDRPLDVSALLDQLLAFAGEPGHFLENAIDGSRIGAAGHSLGGYTVLALATCPFPAGTFDPRIKAILALEGSAQYFDTLAPGIFSTVAVPTLLVGGSLSRLMPLLQITFDALTPGPPVMGYASLNDATHNTFTDGCEIAPASTLDCGPSVLPWRYARHVGNYLAFNFFDATLNGNAEALARLRPAALATIDQTAFQSHTDTCASGDSCGATCTQPCGDGNVGPRERCDSPGAQGTCELGEVCSPNCTTCVDCADATIIGSAGGVFVGRTVGGTAALSSSCGFDVFAPERIFRWTPGVSHLATIETCGGTTNYRTTLYVREGSCLGPDLACNHRACGEASRVTLPVVAGRTYFIVVDGFLADAGDFTLTVN